MKRKHPSQVTLDPDEVRRIQRVRVAAYLGVMPHQTDDMPAGDFNDVLQVMWADSQKRK